MFLLILYNFVTCCFDLIPYCSLALFMTNFTFNSTFVDDGSVNVYLCMNVCVCVCMYLWNLWGKYRGFGCCVWW